MPAPSPILATPLTRRYRQTLRAAPERVFPLLCPERERQWLPGWDGRCIHCTSGLAEAGAVFATRAGSDGDAEVIWCVTEQRPPSRIQFVRWHPGLMVADLHRELHPAGAGAREESTWRDICYTYTALAAAGSARIAAMSEAQWREQMTFWETSLNRRLAAQRE